MFCVMITKVLLFLGFSSILNAQRVNKFSHPDVGLNSKQLIVKYGYPLEIHTIETQDGYILETYRIPYGKKTTTKSGIPVLFIPGLLCTCSAFLSLGPDLSLGFILADQGYDVWLANYRGTTWSMKHKTLDPIRNKEKFFDFSFQEIALYDAIGNIDYILNVTNHKKLFYIGHSQGTTTFFAMAAMKPKYNNKVYLMIALAPVAYSSNVQHVVVSFARQHYEQIKTIAERYGIYELLRHSLLFTTYGSIFCNDFAKTQPLCAILFYLLGGYSPHLNKTAIPVILSEYPAGISTRLIYHNIQIANSEKFQMYDFGRSENMNRYGQIGPPEFNISKITAPVALHYGAYDSLATLPDIEMLASQLPNIVKRKFIKGYAHQDFLYADNIVPMLQNDVIEIMKRYS